MSKLINRINDAILPRAKGKAATSKGYCQPNGCMMGVASWVERSATGTVQPTRLCC